MGRLIPEALYSNELVEEHHLRDVLQGRPALLGPGDSHDYAGDWERAVERIKIIDPLGQRSQALLMQMMAEEKAEKRKH